MYAVVELAIVSPDMIIECGWSSWRLLSGECDSGLLLLVWHDKYPAFLGIARDGAINRVVAVFELRYQAVLER